MSSNTTVDDETMSTSLTASITILPPTTNDTKKPESDAKSAIASQETDVDTAGTSTEMQPDEVKEEKVKEKKEDGEDEEEEEEVQKTLFPPRQTYIIMFALCLAVFISTLDVTIVATALPRIVAELGDIEKYSWIATAFLLTFTAVLPLSGKLSDIFGRRPTLVVCIVIFMVGSALCGASQSLEMLIVSRAIQGIGGGGMLSLVMIVLADIISLRDRGKYQGLLGANLGLATVLGVIAIPIFAIWLQIPNPTGSIKSKLKRIDITGSIIVVIATALLLIGLNWGGDAYAWSSAPVLSTLILGSLFMCLFFYVETYTAVEPIVPVKLLFKNRNFVSASTLNFCFGAAMYGGMFAIPLYFQVVHSDSATTSGLRMLPIMFSLVLASIIAGFLASKTGHFVLFCQMGPVLMAIGGGLFALWNENTFSEEIGFQVISGFGTGMTIQTVIIAVQASVEQEDVATATATTNFFRSLGGVVGVSLMNTILNNKWKNELMALLPPALLNAAGSSKINIEDIKTYPPFIKEAFISSFLKSIVIVWYTITAFQIVAFIASLFMKHVVLRKSVGGGAVGNGTKEKKGDVE
ncbi:hypothetical protein HDU76_003890, partial [Blyttiomyces sp. JEL0837]